MARVPEPPGVHPLVQQSVAQSGQSPRLGSLLKLPNRYVIYMKTCGRCKLRKDLNLFGLNKLKSDGKQAWCRPCVKEYDAKRFQRIKPERYQQVKARILVYNPSRDCF